MSHILKVSPSLLHEEPDGLVVEYRRVFYAARLGFLDLEHRTLQPDGQPYAEDWHLVSDEHLAWLQHVGSDIPQLLSEEAAP